MTSLENILILFTFLSLVGLTYTFRKYKKLKIEKAKLFSQKRSTEVRTGHIVEKFAPFLENFPHQPHHAVFLGQPIDYLVFEEEGVTFSEIKSGKSQLSAKQRQIRDHVKNGRVFWEEIRINEK